MDSRVRSLDDELDYDIPVVTLKNKAHSSEKTYHFYMLVKRIFDIVLSFIALVFLLPVFLLVAIAIKMEDHGPAFYSQTRVGKNRKHFTMYKFRSMCQDADAKLKELESLNEREGPAFKIANDPRITKVGKFIRKTCIDELPQLINIIKGDMSIVGPRPPLPSEVEKYTPYHMQRLGVTPGLTCIWQVNKHENTTFNEWVAMDIKYIKNRSFWMDLKLMFQTVKVVLFGNGEG